MSTFRDPNIQKGQSDTAADYSPISVAHCNANNGTNVRNRFADASSYCLSHVDPIMQPISHSNIQLGEAHSAAIKATNEPAFRLAFFDAYVRDRWPNGRA